MTGRDVDRVAEAEAAAAVDAWVERGDDDGDDVEAAEDTAAELAWELQRDGGRW